MANPVTNFIASLIVEVPVRGKSLDQMIARLQEHGQFLEQQFASMPESKRNHSLMTHIIGIEKWGQQRLRVALGAPYVRDEYDVYRPAKDTPQRELSALFRETRAETVALARQVAASGVESVKAEHNQFGMLTAKGWLNYLDTHASFEAKKLQKAS